ncbi:MAG: hypothetical protein JW867_02400, partial [Candidatus Omnitrophica bacterium]|nr:hypothetical protein [Candidatus Omnitrophota bacterium]
FKHAAFERSASDSIFVKCSSDDEVFGFGESLPREYVTGENSRQAYNLLQTKILPALVGRSFSSFEECNQFFFDCDGMAPSECNLSRDTPQTAAWCAVELSLLDCFGKIFKQSFFTRQADNNSLHYSGVLPADRGFKLLKALLRLKFYGIKNVKIKLGRKFHLSDLAMSRRILGKDADIRIDANMAWAKQEALDNIKKISRFNINCFEQPLAADNLIESAELLKQTDALIMADESFNTAQSLKDIIDKKAFNAVNVRISKCGGYLASLKRCQTAIKEGLVVQLGSQVGESSLLSAANLALLLKLPGIRYAEGCFGLYLLKEDPCAPLMQFGYAGMPPKAPYGYGLGIQVDEKKLKLYSKDHALVG